MIYKYGYMHGNYNILNYKNYEIPGRYNYMYKSGYKPCLNKRSVIQMS